MDQPREWLAGLYRQNRRQLFLIAWSVLRQPELAEDAVHAAFVGLARLAAPPAATAVALTPAGSETLVGVAAFVVVPLPIWPLAL